MRTTVPPSQIGGSSVPAAVAAPAHSAVPPAAAIATSSSSTSFTLTPLSVPAQRVAVMNSQQVGRTLSATVAATAPSVAQRQHAASWADATKHALVRQYSGDRIHSHSHSYS